MRDEAPLIGWGPLIKGFIAGALIAGSIVNPFGAFIQAVLFIIGVVVFIEGLFPFGSMIYPLEMVFSAVCGIIASIVLFFVNWSAAFTGLMLITASLLYAIKGYRRMKR